MKIPGLVMVPPATPSKKKISWRCSISKMCLRSLQLRNVLVWCDQIMFFTHHLPCAARSEFINMLSTQMLISGSKPYRARHTGTIASGLIKKTNWSRLVDIDQGTMIKTTFDNKGKLIKMIKTLLPCPSEFVTGLRSQIRVSDSNKCHKLTACSTSYPSKSFVKFAIVLRATQKTLSFSQTWICGRSEKSDLFVRFKQI